MHRALHFRLAPVISREALLSRIRDSSLDTTGVRGMDVVQFVDLSDLEQVLPVVAMNRAQVTVVQDQILVLIRLVGESIRDNVI